MHRPQLKKHTDPDRPDRLPRPPLVEDLHLDLECSLGSPALARAAITDWARELALSEQRVDALRLLVSEAVSNAVRHPYAPADERIRLAASFSDGEVCVTVTDAGTGPLPSPRPPGHRGGFGLHLIATESRRWGVERADGTRLWFVL